MATIGALANVIAEGTGVCRSRVAVQARELRTAGVLTSGGRGFGASSMSPFDAASLLLGVLGADAVNESSKAVAELSVMPGKASSKPKTVKRFIGNLEAKIGSDPPLLWALSVLLQSVAHDDVFPEFAQRGVADAFTSPDMSFKLYKPVPAATITITGNRFFVGYRFGGLTAFEAAAAQDIEQLYERFVVKPIYPDGYVIKTAKVGLETIRRIAAVTIGDGPDPLLLESSA